jgi:hypothetical protein
MTDSPRALALAVALALLVAVDAVIARVDVFTPLMPATRPAGFFSLVNYQLTDVVRTLSREATTPRPWVFLGNSQMESVIHPLSAVSQRLVEAGAPDGTRALSLCVIATAPTDAEVVARSLGPLHPDVVVFGIGAPDIGTSLEQARNMPVTRNLDVGWRDGLVPPADLEARLDRWVRTGWRLYRYRRLLRDLVLRPPGPRMSAGFFDAFHTQAELLALDYGPQPSDERTARLLALRPAFEHGEPYADVVRYLDELRGPEYLRGLRERWRHLEPRAIQLEALVLATVHVRAAGGRPVWVVLPENPILERDPEIGGEVRRRSDAIVEQVAARADASNVPLIDERAALPPSAFLDLNHVFPSRGESMKPLVARLAARGLLRE